MGPPCSWCPDFKLDVGFALPDPATPRETLRAKPDSLPYPKKYPRNRHFGKNLEMVIDKALAEENPEMKEGFTQVIGNYMKLAYSNWHKESVHDDAIKGELGAITGGRLQYQPGPGGSSANVQTNQPLVQQLRARRAAVPFRRRQFPGRSSQKRKALPAEQIQEQNSGKSNKHNKHNKNRNK